MPNFIMPIALFALVYFTFIRPQKKKQNEVIQMRNQMKIGDTVVTIGGLFAKVKDVNDDFVVLQMSLEDEKNVDVKAEKWAIGKIVSNQVEGIQMQEETENIDEKKEDIEKEKEIEDVEKINLEKKED